MGFHAIRGGQASRKYVCLWSTENAEVLYATVIWVSDLAVLIPQLGMNWLEFKPTDGLLRAEGNGWVLTSTQLRSVGWVVNIQPYYTPDLSRARMLVPTEAAQSMTFGILSTGPSWITEFPIGNIDHVLRWMRVVKLPTECLNFLKELEGDGNPLYGFVDLIPMLSTFLRQRQSVVTRVPAPIANPYGILHSATGRTAFIHQLQRFEDENIQINGVFSDFHERWNRLSSCEEGEPLILGGSQNVWFTPDNVSVEWNDLDLSYLELVHDTWDWTSQKIEHVCKSNNMESDMESNIILSDIVMAHVQHSILARAQAEKNGETYFYSKLKGEVRDWQPVFAETMHLWFEGLESMYRDVQQRSPYFHQDLKYETFVELWLLVVLKGMCWDSAHYMVDGMRVGSEHWGSRMPIYIG